MSNNKREKRADQLIGAIILRGIDDVAQNMYGDSITIPEDPELERLYYNCLESIKELMGWIDARYPEAEHETLSANET